MNTRTRKKVFFWIVILVGLFFSAGQIFTTSAETGSSASLVINELVADNGVGLIDEDGNHSDWIELYNQGNSPINLAGWALTDDPNQPDKWTFPDTTLGSHQYLVVFASGKNRQGNTPGAALHTNFKLKQEGDFLGLHNILEDKFVDLISPQFPPQFRDMAYGRYGSDLAYGYMNQPTPGGPNNETQVWAGVVAPVEFSAARGFYEAPFTLQLETLTPGATIRYTTDGSEPTETNGQVYAEPITVETTTVVRAAAFKPNFLSSDTATQSYVFLRDVLAQPSNPPGFPQSWGAQLTDAQDYTRVAPVPADYEMDPEVVNDPRYRDTLKDNLQSLPTLSLVMPTSSLADLYSHSGDNGPTWEQPISLEFIYPDSNNSQDFQINAGLKLQGSLTPGEISKPSFRLLFKNEYGPTKLDYPLFPDSSVKEFDSLILRATSLDEPTAATRDEWLRAAQNVMSGLSPHDIFVHLYINGLYWGMYNVVERPDASFMSAYLGGEKDDWFIANQAGPLNPDKGSAADPLNYLFTVLSFAGDNNSGLTQTDQLTQLYTNAASYFDPAQFSDYIILNWYAQAMNWPTTNWQVAIHRQNSLWQGKILVWNEPTGTTLQSSGVVSSSTGIDQALFATLLQNPDFRMQLADRMYQHLFNGGALTDAQAQTRWLHQNHTLEEAIVGEIARWGDARPKPPTQEEWRKAQDEVAQRMKGAAGRFITMAREAGYYPELDPPIFSQEGGLVETGFTLNMSLPKLSQGGTIYYTTDSSDPRMPVTGDIGPTAVAYSGPVMFTANTLVKARVWDGQAWSALNQANFSVVAQDNKLRLTEIMYNPVEGDDLEFMELKNMGEAEVALADVSIVEGVSFIFPPNTPALAPGQFTMLVSNPTAFAERYPNVPIGGVYDGHLSNKGEKITVVDAEGAVIIEVEYNDEYGWPVSADGRGDSLVLFDPDGDPNDPQNWRASARVSGSPGADEPAAQVSQPMN